MTQRRLRLDGHELVVLLDGKHGLGRVRDLPHDDRGDVDGVTVGVVDLQFVGLEVTYLDGDLLLGGEGDGHQEASPADRADVTAEELHHLGVAGADDRERREDHRGEEEDDDTQGHPPPPARAGIQRDAGQDDLPGGDSEQRECEEQGQDPVEVPSPLLFDVDACPVAPYRAA